jgi:hypothetical protein
MKDQRIPVLRRALDALLDSLDATLRLRAWSGPEEIPEPLRASADRLVERLRSADRLASLSVRDEQDAKRVEAMTGAIKRLDVAYVTFRQTVERAPTTVNAAISALREEIDLVKEGNDAWSAR